MEAKKSPITGLGSMKIYGLHLVCGLEKIVYRFYRIEGH